MADRTAIFMRDESAYRESLSLGMEFLAGAVIDDPADPDHHSFCHMYHVELGGWNRPYMELAGQVVREAFLPYADLTGERRWEDLAWRVIVDGVLAHAACADVNSSAYGLLCNCADRPCDYGSPLSGEEMVKYRLDRAAYLAAHPGCRRDGRYWVTFDSAEVLMAAILLARRRPDPRLEEFIDRSWRCFLRITDGEGNAPVHYDDLEGRWGQAEITTTSRLLWACGLMRQAGRQQPQSGLAERLADNLLRRQWENGIIAALDTKQVVPEFVVYCIEGLFWGGVLLERAAWVEAARRSFDALLAAPHVMAGSPYFVYTRDWQPVPADHGREIQHMSVVGQVANLALRFWRQTGEDRYRDIYRLAVDLQFSFQDRRSTGPARGGIPRSTNMPWWRETCAVYTYASALMARFAN